MYNLLTDCLHRNRNHAIKETGESDEWEVDLNYVRFLKKILFSAVFKIRIEGSLKIVISPQKICKNVLIRLL